MGVKSPKKINDIDDQRMKAYLDDMKAKKKYWLGHLDDPKCFVRLQNGNTKTGHLSKTVSLAPVIDCPNCNVCKGKCYDLRNDCCYENVRNDRARNSAIHQADIARFWREIEEAVKAEFVIFLRINVGGDLRYEDYNYLREMAERCPKTTFQFFTKNTKDLIRWYDEGNSFPDNVKKLVSKWAGMDIPNPYHWPEAHVNFADGSCTAPLFGAYFCRGNCSACYFNEEGCPSLKNGEHAVYSDVVNGGYLLPKKGKYTMKDFKGLLTEWSQLDALFIINCSATYWNTNVSRIFETAKFLTLCELGIAVM